jgi:DNA repair protein RadC
MNRKEIVKKLEALKKDNLFDHYKIDEIINQLQVCEPQGRLMISEDIANAATPYLDCDKETLVLLACDSKYKIIDIQVIATGSMISCPVHPREVFRPLIVKGAIAFAIAHNHPSSGDPEPSKEDLEITRRLKKASDMLGIAMLDHVVVGDGCHVSLRERLGSQWDSLVWRW